MRHNILKLEKYTLTFEIFLTFLSLAVVFSEEEEEKRF